MASDAKLRLISDSADKADRDVINTSIECSAESKKWDVLIRNATIFDGSGTLPYQGDVALRDGKVAACDVFLSGSAKQVIDAKGLWLMPGLLDIHTHFDLEVELSPGLPEAVRHGTTTVVVSNCSLGLAFGAQREEGADPIVDCFARVENVPKAVLKKVADKVNWNDSKGYLDHLDQLPLGANIVPMIPHSMLRIEVMGFVDSISRDPTETELAAMSELLEDGMQQGYVGFSTDGLPYHYLANDPNRRRKIPTQYSHYDELKRLTNVVRRYDRVWQATPAKDDKLAVIKNFLLTSGRLHGKRLKVTAVAALDVVANRGLLQLSMLLTYLLNSWVVKGCFRLQALAAPFKVWGQGPITPIFEEIDEFRLLIEPDLEDREGRMAVLKDPEFIEQFIAMWNKGKRGLSVASIKRSLYREDFAFRRDLTEMFIERCPVSCWSGLSFAQVFERVRDHQRGAYCALDVDEINALGLFPTKLRCEGLFLLSLLEQFDTQLFWHSVFANDNSEKMLNTLLHPKILPGFNDSGAHLTNMAFYDANLRGLQAAKRRGLATVAYLIRRLTKDPAEFFDIDAGTIDVGVRADIVLINPVKLQAYDSEYATRLMYRPEFDHHQLVNRSDDVVPYVFVSGHLAWSNNEYSPQHGTQKWGHALTAQCNTRPEMV